MEASIKMSIEERIKMAAIQDSEGRELAQALPESNRERRPTGSGCLPYRSASALISTDYILPVNLIRMHARPPLLFM